MLKVFTLCRVSAHVGDTERNRKYRMVTRKGKKCQHNSTLLFTPASDQHLLRPHTKATEFKNAGKQLNYASQPASGQDVRSVPPAL